MIDRRNRYHGAVIARLAVLVLLLATPLAAQESAHRDKLDELVTRLASIDPFTAYFARKDLDAWALEAGASALPALQEMRHFADGPRADALDDAITRLGGTPPPRPPTPTKEEVLDALLDRLAGNDAQSAKAATEELDSWIKAAGADSRKLLEARRAAAGERLNDGIDLALARLDRIERVRALEDLTDSDALRAWTLLKSASSPDPLQSRPSRTELRQWSCAEPEKVRERLAGFREHTDSKIAEEAAVLVHELDQIVKWLPLLKSLEALQIPSTSGCERVYVPRTKDVSIPAMPGETNSEWSAHGWLISRLLPRATVLFDDGCVRTGCFTRDNVDFPAELSAVAGADPDQFTSRRPEAFWRAALFARWALEQERLQDAAGCAGIAGRLAEAEWPGETPEKLANRLLRQGADYLLRRADEPVLKPGEGRDLCLRLVALPFDDARERGEAELLRVRWCNDLKAAWRSVHPCEVSTRSVRMQVDYWTWRLLDPEEVRSAGIGGIIESADREDATSADPVTRLAALGWQAVPYLVARLAEGSATSLKGPTIIRFGDVCAILLWRLMGDCAKPKFISDPSAPWNIDAAERQLAVLERWRILGMLDERSRWQALNRDHSPRAMDWFVAHDPAEVLDDLFKSLPAAGRPRALAIRRLAVRLAAAPREKLEALIPTSSGEVGEVLKSALEATELPK